MATGFLSSEALLITQVKNSLRQGIPLNQRKSVNPVILFCASAPHLFTFSKNSRGELERIPRLVERYKQAVLVAAFAGQLTAGWRTQNGVSLESDWKRKTLGEVSVDIRYGTAVKCHYQPRTTPVLRIPNVVAGRIDSSDLKYAEFNDKELATLALREGDLLVIRSNGSLNLVRRAPEKAKPKVAHAWKAVARKASAKKAVARKAPAKKFAAKKAAAKRSFRR
jgi:hypothetical protein